MKQFNDNSDLFGVFWIVRKIPVHRSNKSNSTTLAVRVEDNGSRTSAFSVYLIANAYKIDELKSDLRFKGQSILANF